MSGASDRGTPDGGAPGHGAAGAAAAATWLRAQLPVQAPTCAIILGSGLQGLADRIERATRVPYTAIPGFHASTVVGHRGELIHGQLGGREVVAFAGRFHLYEGHAPAVGAFPVRVAHALGARVLFLSNAAGGIRRTFVPGDLMLLADHLNLMFRNPLVGTLQPGDARFPDMSAPYAPRLQALLREAAAEVGLPLQVGVYAGLLGPTYETPAEVRMLERLGADAVGMSTVPETVVAAALGMEVAAVSLITNPAAGLAPGKLDHAEVVEAGRAAAQGFEALVARFVARL